MTEQADQPRPPLSKAELRARLIGNSFAHDEEDLAYWRAAGEQERGETLYQLLRFAQNILDSTPPRPEEPLTFPGFPPRHTPRKPSSVSP